MFLQASHENLENGILVWIQYALASGLHLNWRNVSLNNHVLKEIWNVSDGKDPWTLGNALFFETCGIHWE